MGTAKEHEVRVMGLVLAALALLGMCLALWFAASLGAQLRSHAPSASVTQSQGGSLGASVIAQR